MDFRKAHAVRWRLPEELWGSVANLNERVAKGLLWKRSPDSGEREQSCNEREASNGQPELHEKQADLMIVQSGRAMIIIGGKVVDGKTTAPNEIRGTSLEGGERVSLKAGDVLYIPANIPHQMLLDAGQTLDYIVLKVDSQ